MACNGVFSIQNSGGTKLMLKSIIDTILGPVITFLNYALDKLNSISMVADRGLNLDYYLGSIGALGPNWITLVKTLILCLALLTLVFVTKTVYNIYLNAKEGVQWW